MATVEVLEGPDAGLAWHHGDPVREQRTIEQGGGVARLGNRGILTVTGADRLGWLHSLTSQHLSELRPGAATTALLLSPQGHVEHVLHGVDDGTTFWAWTEPGRRDELVGWLDRMRFMMRVEVAARDDLELVWAGREVPAPEAAAARRESDLAGGVEYFVPVGTAVDGQPVGSWALEAVRIAEGVPRIGLDTDHRTIPNEIGLLGTHLDKGCYRGQETVARVHTLGRPPRRLVQLELDGSMDQLPAVGAPLMLDGREVGFVGGSARHHEMGPIALGLVKRNVDPAATLVVDGIAASQQVLVDPEVGLHVRPRL